MNTVAFASATHSPGSCGGETGALGAVRSPEGYLRSTLPGLRVEGMCIVPSVPATNASRCVIGLVA